MLTVLHQSQDTNLKGSRSFLVERSKSSFRPPGVDRERDVYWSGLLFSQCNLISAENLLQTWLWCIPAAAAIQQSAKEKLLYELEKYSLFKFGFIKLIISGIPTTENKAYVQKPSNYFIS